jgi:ABC-2 type transport system permease protein
MPEPGWGSHGLAIGRQEFRRTLRGLRSDSTRLAFLAFGGLFISIFVLFGTWLVLQFAGDLTAYELTDTIRGSFGLQWLFAAFIFAQRAGSRYDRIDNESLMLLTVSVRSVVVGLLGAEFLRALTYIIVPMALIGGAFVYATASPLTAPFLVLAAALFLLTSLVVGYAIGLAAKLLVARVRFVARYKSVLSVVAVFAFIGVYFLFQNTGSGGPTALLGLLPASWLVDLAVVGSPVVGDPVRAAVAGLGGVVWIVAWGLLAERIATALWFGDTVEHEVAQAKARVETGTGDDPLAAAVRPLAFPSMRQPTLRIAQRAVLVARRNPSRLTFVFLPVIFLGSMLISVAQSGALFAVVPPVLALVVPWLAGATFGLNPFGDEGPVLPATLTSLASGRQYALGIALPGLVLGVPLVLVTTVGTGLYGPYTVTEVGLLASIALVCSVLAVTAAPAVGTLFPRYDPVRVGSEREVVPPSLSAIVVYTLALVVPGAIAVGSALAPAATRRAFSLLVGGLFALPFSLLAGEGLSVAGGVATWFQEVGTAIANLPTAWVHWGGYGIPLVVALGLTAWSFRAVGRRFEGYTVE